MRSWTLWDFAEPDAQATDKCVRVRGITFKWRTMRCAIQFQYICELPLGRFWDVAKTRNGTERNQIANALYFNLILFRF